MTQKTASLKNSNLPFIILFNKKKRGSETTFRAPKNVKRIK